MKSIVERGSEWRRWDLHVHTPETAMNNRFGDWDEYLDKIESHPDVKVIGVTDYLTITNYSKLKRYKEQGRIGNIDLLIPNIEFRVSPPSDKGAAVNIHLLISPEDPRHEENINDALTRLTYEYNREFYACIPSGLIRLGKAVENTITDDNVALTKGVESFKVSFTDFQKWYRNEFLLKTDSNSLIAVAAGNDGSSGFSYEGGWGAHREEIERFSDIIFSGREGDRKFWLGKRKLEDMDHINKLGGLKPCVHGSDAHSTEKLFNPDMERYCWIKADTTFEGLRQILYEPENRVHIGPTPPIYHDEARVIKSVKISNADRWLDDVEIPLNSGLVSIIGQRGSGKSALAELIAYAAGNWEANDPSSFLMRAENYLDGTQIDITWADGEVDSVTLWSQDENEKKIRFLSQNFVERLCSEDELGIDLIQEIESVVFSHINPYERLNASNFEELRNTKTEGIREEGQRIKNEINRLIEEQIMLRDNRSKLAEKRNRIKALDREKNGLEKQILVTDFSEEAVIERNLQVKRENLSQQQQVVARNRHILQKISDIRMRISAFRIQMNKFFVELKTQLHDVGLLESEYEKFEPIFYGDAESPLASLENRLKNLIREKMGSSDNPEEGTIAYLQAEINNLDVRQTADKARQEKIKNAQIRIAVISAEIDRVNTEIARIEGAEKERLDNVVKERRQAYAKYFVNMKREQDLLVELYGPVVDILQGEDSSEYEKRLELSIRWIVDFERWIERGAVLFDQRRILPYESIEKMTQNAREILLPAWTSGDPQEIESAHGEFLDEFIKNDYRSSGSRLRSGVAFKDLLQWLFEVEHISLSYGLKYNSTELKNLSPGTKGIVLLILYLGIDHSDTRPLIVDQPDENLDNESIFDFLVSYFRSAKQRRQVILISHNPNLVVNTDSEQIIVAHAERQDKGLPRMQYVSGALENTNPNGEGIRQLVCKILEGGETAFLNREKRYALKKQ